MESVSRGSPFVDFLNLSFPLSDFATVMQHVLEYVTLAGGCQVTDYACELAGGLTVTWGERGRVGWLRFSGRAVRAFEAAHVWVSMLSLIAEYEHRVTGMHVAVDRVEDGAKVVKRIARRGRNGSIRLTRKRVPSHDVKTIMGQAHYGPVTTGTVYLGRRTADVWAKVYDKREEILVRCGATSADAVALNDSGPLTRYEISFGRHVGLSLQDVHDPRPVFWRHAVSVLAAPEGIPDWQPGGSGYVLPPRREVLPAQQLELLLEQSRDVRRMVKLADDIGPRGRDWLVSRFTKRVKTHPIGDSPIAAS